MEIKQKENSARIEEFNIPQTDCYVEFGHSIGKGKDGKWYLSRLLQTVEDTNVVDNETGRNWYERTGRLESINSNSNNAVVGGGVFVTAALAEAYRTLLRQNKAPKFIIHSGGRPKYLEDNAPDKPQISESAIMHEFFNKKLKGLQIPPQEIINTTKTTMDDITHSLDKVLECGGKSVTFVGLGMRFPRLQALYIKVVSETDKYNGIKIHLLAAEDVLRSKAEQLGRGTQFDMVWNEFINSEGYKRTMTMEEAGIKRLLTGTYDESPQGAGTT